MSRFPLSVAVLSSFLFVGCWTGDKIDGDTSDDEGTDTEDAGIQPQGGNWDIITSGWTNDDCNATEGLQAPSSLTIADVSASSFSVTIYDGDIRIGDGSTTCTSVGDDIYECDEIKHGFDYTDVDASISMSGPISITLSSETAAAGKGDLVLECAGSDCDEVAGYTNSGSFPCGTTLNWTAEAQ